MVWRGGGNYVCTVMSRHIGQVKYLRLTTRNYFEQKKIYFKDHEK